MSAFLQILHEGPRWVVINKPAGIATEKHYQHDTVEARAQVQWKRPRSTKPAYVGIPHRLDRPVSGALLLAQNKSTLVFLNEAFAAGKVDKTYVAATERPLPQAAGKLKHFLTRDRFGRKAIAATRPLPGAKESLLEYRLLEKQPDHYLWEIKPITGRFHQIRVQLATAGAPIIGDVTYGSTRMLAPHVIALHAYQLTFPTPEDERITVEATLPSWFAQP
ncbi:MAG: RNA pseudouridine synthase [Bacteroidota bacterium]